MRTKLYNPAILVYCGIFSLVGLQALAAFDSGSDGSYGPITITQNTVLDAPSNGVFKCSTINISCGATLSFKPNPLNTPIYLLATNDVNINGYIIVDGGGSSGTLGGAAGPGGFAGGQGGIAGGHTQGGDGLGPGAGKNASGLFVGVYGATAFSNTNVYGNALLVPLVGGSGASGKDAGAGGVGGSGGGGAILIASNTKITVTRACYPNDQGIYARGGGVNTANGACGSGGAIRLIAPIVMGNGYIDVSGGQGAYPNYFTGSPGRIRVDCTDDYNYRTLTYFGSFSRGSQMFAFQTNSLQLDITSAAGQSIPVGTTNGVTVSLPFGSPTNQVVALQALNITSNTPVRIAVTPDTGASSVVDGVITNTGNPSVASFNVIIPAGTISKINAWTR